jgi:hypothetical protein
MRPIEIEAWVLRVVDQVKRGQPNEDSRVELKSEWIEPEKAARQIAGHANAARGSTILWIIGLDEKKGVVGADYNNLANWLPAVKSSFDELAPEVFELNVPVDGKMLVALLFETDRAPYVVKNPKGGQVELEVPWRELTKTRTARRSDLIRLLEPLIYLPTIEIFTAEFTIYPVTTNGKDRTYQYDVKIKTYITPRSRDSIFIPCHRCNLSLFLGDVTMSDWQTVRLTPPLGAIGMAGSHTIRASDTEAIVEGPGQLKIEFFAIQPSHSLDEIFEVRKLDELKQDVKMVLKVLPTGAQIPVSISLSLESTSQYGDANNGGILGRWYLKP